MIARLLPEVERLTSTARACALLGKPRASLYRQRNRPAGPRRKPGPAGPPPNALDAAERTEILTVLCEPRFADKAVAQVWAELLDEASKTETHSLPGNYVTVTFVVVSPRPLTLSLSMFHHHG